MLQPIGTLPEETCNCMHQELELLGLVQDQIDRLEARIKERIQLTESMQLIKTLPGVGEILSLIITLEVGSADRFPAASHLASYSGNVPRVRSSGGKQRHFRMIKQVNDYLNGLSSRLPMSSS